MITQLHRIAALGLTVLTLFTNTSFAADSKPLDLKDLGVQETRRDPVMEAQLETRHSRLGLHQKLGIATWGLMAGSVLLAEKAKTSNVHQFVGAAAAASYFTTAYLSMSAPDPLKVSGKSGTNIKIHKVLRWIHLPLMVAIPFAGIQANDQVKHNKPESGLGKYKGAIGAAAFITYTLAGSVMLFEF